MNAFVKKKIMHLPEILTDYITLLPKLKKLNYMKLNEFIRKNFINMFLLMFMLLFIQTCAHSCAVNDIEKELKVLHEKMLVADDVARIIIETPAVKTLMIEELSDQAGKSVPDYIEGYEIIVRKKNNE